jgi:Asp-tRNA(Asn)/Glu-tRNA(Gln) amidotransferase A subunit family amidase
MTPADYGRAQSWCRALRQRYDSLRGKADGFITLNATGAAPEGMAVGNPIYGDVSSVLGTPAFNLPLMAIDGMPLGLQLMGFHRTDFELAAVAHWLVHVTIGRVAERGSG